MKKFLMLFLIGASILTGCGKAETQNETENVGSENQEKKTDGVTDDATEHVAEHGTEDAAEDASEDVTETQEETDFTKQNNLYDTLFDANRDVLIKERVDEIVESSKTIQEEIQAVENFSKEYTDLAQEYYSQLDMNMISGSSWMVWDTELNSLWSRMSNSLDEKTKEEILYDLRVWNARKEDYIVESIGESENGGSIYPLLYNMLMEEMTRKKVHMLADIYAEAIGETYTKPEFAYTGMYANCEGTMDIYDSLMISYSSYSLQETLEAEIGLYRITTLNGSITESGDTLYYTDDTYNLTGIITCDWDGATFTIETSDFDYLQPGDTFTFDTIF